MVKLITLPGYAPSPLMDFSQINQAFNNRREQANVQAKLAAAEKQQLEQQRQFDASHTLAKGQDARDAAMAPLRERLVTAQATAAERPPTTEEITQFQYARKNGFPGTYMDFQKQYHLNRIGPKSEIDGAVADLVRSMGQGQQQGQPPQQGQSPIRPQSYDGGNDDPMLVPTQAGGGQPMPQQQPPAPELIDTPAGRMTAENARRLSFALGLAGKGDAGKMLMEESNKSALSAAARGEMDKKEVNAINSVGQLRQIIKQFKPEFQTYEASVQNFGVGVLDSFQATRKNIPPDVIEKHKEFVNFKRTALAFITQGINDATGAAMGIQEEKRIRGGIPDPETDNPTKYLEKAKSNLRDLDMVIARTRFLRKNGFNGSPFTGNGDQAASILPVDQFSRMIESDTRKLYQQLRQQNPNVDDGEIKRGVRQQIRGKYGLDT